MDDAVDNFKMAVMAGRTDVLNTVLEGCAKHGSEGALLREKILNEVTVPEGTFLHLATKLGLQDVVRALLLSGADPTVENRDGENPFELTSSENLQQVYVEELLRATAISDLPRVEQLLKAGVDPNSWDCDDKKNSVLHWAVSFGNADTVSYLISKGAKVNSETSEGVTPLHDAVDRSDIDIITILLLNNASPLVKAESGKFKDQSPLDLAATKPEVFFIVSKHLASQFKGRTYRSNSIDSIGPESPVFPRDIAIQSPTEKNNNGGHNNDYPSLYAGFSSALEGILRSLELKGPITPICTDPNLSLLWPQPKSLQQLSGSYFYPSKILQISVVKSSESVHRILDVLAFHKESFEAIGFDVVAHEVKSVCSPKSSVVANEVECCINPHIFSNRNSYRLHITSQKVKISGSDLTGLNCGIATFLQLLTLCTKEDSESGIPPVIINDYPSLNHRAVLLDISQERIPTIDNLYDIIRILCALKINYIHLQLRLDKTGFPQVYSKGELVAIDRQCQDACITLIPAIDIPSDLSIIDYCHYVKPILRELLPCFTRSKYIHVGPQLSQLIFTSDLQNSLSFDTLWEFLPLPSEDVVVMLCYNGIKPQLINSSHLLNVPSNLIFVDYGFQADYNFGNSIMELTQNGCSVCVCVGTSAWSSLSGCPEASLCNIYNGILSAVNNSSFGMIVANWSGSANFTPKPFAWPGFLLASGLAWNHLTHWEYLQGSLSNLISTYIIKDKTGLTGQVVLQLGCSETSLLRSANGQAAHDMANLPPSDGTTLYKLLTDPDSVALDNLSMESFIVIFTLDIYL